MKKAMVIFHFLIAFTGAASAVDLHPRSLTHVTERPASGSSVTLVKDGQPTFAIVWDKLREQASRGSSRPSATPATEVLADAFERSTGVRPPIVDLKLTNMWSRFPTRIWVGNTPAAREAGLVMEKLRDQQIFVRTVKDGVIIIGYDTIDIPGWARGPDSGLDFKGVGYGTLWAAYDFCERVLGMRYYHMGEGIVSQPCRDLVLQPCQWESEPFYNTRGNPFGIHCSFQRLEKRQTEFHDITGSKSAEWQAFVRAWRLGGTLPLAGKHSPDPEPMAKRFPDKMKTIFYTSPNGHLWYSKTNYFDNYFNPVDLGFADILVDVWKEIYDSRGKRMLAGLQGGMVNNTFINFGVSDVLLSPADYISDPVIRREGLVTEADLNRPDTTRAAMANVYGRFYTYLCKRLEKELPGKTLFALLYYNSKWAPTRYKMPKNFDGIVCDGSLIGYIKNPEIMKTSRELFKGWYDAMDGRPPSMAYIYGSSNQFVGAVNPAWVGDIPKVLGGYLGRQGLFFDSDMDWRIFHAYYCCAKAQWDPDFDVQAALDEMWERLYGSKAAKALRVFQRTLYAAVENECMKSIANGNGVSLKTVEALETSLAEAGAALEPGSVEAKRFRLFAGWWPDAFAAQRRKLTAKKPLGVTNIPYRWAKMIDWSLVPALPNTPNLKLVWDEKGLYGSADDVFDITVYAGATTNDLAHRIAYDTRVPGFTITWEQFGAGVAPTALKAWQTDRYGQIRFAGRGEWPLPKGMDGESMGFKTGEIQTMIIEKGPEKTRSLDLTIANPLRPYTIRFCRIGGRCDMPWTYQNSLLGDGVHGFGCFAGPFRLKVNGLSADLVRLDKRVCRPWEDGDKRGWKVLFDFDGARVDVVFFMCPKSPLLYGFVSPSPETLKPIESCQLVLAGIPSGIPERMSPPNEPRRQVLTAKRLIRPPEGFSGPHHTVSIEVGENWFLLEDAGLDGSAEGKGIGPCYVATGSTGVAKAAVSLGRARDILLTYDLAKGFKRFTFALWEDRAQRHSNAEIEKAAREGFKGFKGATK